MKSLIFKLLSYVSIIILLTSSVVINSDNKCNVTIKITDISVIKGDIYIAIYDNQNAFDNKNAINSKRLKVTSTKEEYTVSLPIGEYAVILYQDLNKNKKLDRLFSVPLEPYGVSNNVNGFPSFDSAKFTLKKIKQLLLILKSKSYETNFIYFSNSPMYSDY
ncbi:DUF2141 domain-containing protein [Parabacteroides sp. BX2]|uniref:DUF2141 domain-containing protein n=1 Tax=Parabacteroides segnis TaxID=2763058 RepID=A0ABR7DYC9_9BACT|nr:DUF2141 domain-containing protein [Parabacteroides segnis]MBC5641829.1 DUF2141 domain-containing protein [Parabacteroides segnis]